jgi:hypothetical protein
MNIARQCHHLRRYVRTMLQLMDVGSEEVSDDVWYRAVHVVANATIDRRPTADAIAKSLECGSLSVPLINTAGYAPSLIEEVSFKHPEGTVRHIVP